MMLTKTKGQTLFVFEFEVNSHTWALKRDPLFYEIVRKDKYGHVGAVT